MDIFTEISNWSFFQVVVVFGFGWIAFQLSVIIRHLATLREFGDRQRLKELEDSWGEDGWD